MTPEEKALLGAVISRNNAIGVALESVQPDDFSTPAGSAIYQAIITLSRDTRVVDPVMLGNVLDDSILKEVGGRVFLHTLIDACPFPTNAKGYAHMVREASIDRQAKSVIKGVRGTGSAYVAAVQDGLFSIERKEQQGANAQVTAGAILATAGRVRQGLEYPWSSVQGCTRGMRPGWLCVLAGRPSHGKSAAALMISDAAVSAGKKVVYNSLEMSESDCVSRLAMLHGLSGERYWADRMTPADGDVLQRMADDPKWANFRVENAHGVGQLAPLCRRWGADLLVIDHLQLLAGEKYEDLARTTRELKLLAGSLDIPVLLLSQLSRGDAAQENTLPGLSRLRGSGTIEQDADSVIMIWRKRSEDGQLMGEAIISVAKSRHGHTATFRAHFDGDRQEFRLTTEGQG